MRWSKLKQRIEGNFAPAVRGRVELFQTRYRRAPDDFGEIWVTVDGKRCHSWGDASASLAEGVACFDLLSPALSRREKEFAMMNALEEQGFAFRWEVHALLVQSLSLPVEKLLKHRSPVVRGLAMLDGRCGKRRLRSLGAGDEHPFVERMLTFRRDAEGLGRVDATSGPRDRGP